MVTSTVEFENGPRWLVGLVLDEREDVPDERTHCMRLQHPPLYVLMSMNCTKPTALEQGMLPVGGTADKDVHRDHCEQETDIDLY